MDDKNVQIYIHYPLKIDNVYKTKGVVYLETKEGLYAVKSYNYTEKKLCLENEIKKKIVTKGYTNIDRCIANNDGQYITFNKYGNKFVVKKWYYGEECNINDINELRLAGRELAKLHKAMVDVDITMEEDVILGKSYLVKEYQNHINELKRVKKYIYNKKRKNTLELDILKNIDYYYKQAMSNYEKLVESSYESMYEEAILKKKVCHGNYTYHSILVNKEEAAIINLDKMSYGVQIYDLYSFVRKAMEKNNWDIEIAKNIIESYDKVSPLSDEEKYLISILFGYPEKYRKLINSYYNGKKAWVSIRIQEKLTELVVTENIRQKFIEELKQWWGI